MAGSDSGASLLTPVLREAKSSGGGKAFTSSSSASRSAEVVWDGADMAGSFHEVRAGKPVTLPGGPTLNIGNVAPGGA